jgi:hypothetical protein
VMPSLLSTVLAMGRSPSCAWEGNPLVTVAFPDRPLRR